MKFRLRTLFATSLLLAAALTAQADDSESFEIRLTLTEERLPTADWQALEADFDSDGHLDLALSFPKAAAEHGELIVLFGPAADLPDVLSLEDLSDHRHLRLQGDWAGDRFGQALAWMPARSTQPSPLLAVGAPGTHTGHDADARGSVYLFNLQGGPELSTLAALDGQIGTRLTSSAEHAGLGEDFIGDAAVGLAISRLNDSPHSLWVRRAPSPAQATHLSSELSADSVSALGHLTHLDNPSHQRFNSSGGRVEELESGHEISALIEADTQQAQLIYGSEPIQGNGPEINFGDGIEDQFVLAGTTFMLDFVISDPFEPPEQLSVNLSFETASPLIIPTSVVVTGTGGIRTLIVDTVAGQPEGAVPFSVFVMNGQKQTAQADFLLNVLNSSTPEINGGLGLDDETVNPGDTLVKPFQVNDLLFFADNLLYSATSSNPALIPPTSIQFGGDGDSRVITIPTTPGTSGQSLITVDITNPLNETAIADFLLTVGTPGSGGPLINGGAGIQPQFVTESQRIDIPFQISDPTEAAASLIVNAISSDQALISDNQLQLLGNGETRLLRINTRNDITGVAQITVIVSNASGLSTQAPFEITIRPRGGPLLNFGIPFEPQIGSPGQLVEWQVTVGDTVDPPNALQLSASSLDPDVLPDSAISLFGSSATRLVRARIPQNAEAGSVEIELELVNTQGLSATGTLELIIEIPDGPIINRDEPIPDQVLIPGTTTVIDVPIESRDGEPGIFDVVVFSLDQLVLPDEALRLIGEGEDFQLEIDIDQGQPGTTIIVIRATGPDGGVTETSFEITIDNEPTDLELMAEPIDLAFGDQRFSRITVENTGDNRARNIDLRLNAGGQITLISTLSQASGCSVDDGNTVSCEDRYGAGWDCQGSLDARRCRIDGLSAQGQAILLLGVSDGVAGSVLVEVEADNAEPSSTLIDEGE